MHTPRTTHLLERERRRLSPAHLAHRHPLPVNRLDGDRLELSERVRPEQQGVVYRDDALQGGARHHGSYTLQAQDDVGNAKLQNFWNVIWPLLI